MPALLNTERKMDALGDKVAGELEMAGYKSLARLKVGRLPHKSPAGQSVDYFNYPG